MSLPEDPLLSVPWVWQVVSSYDRLLNCLQAAVCLGDPQELSTEIILVLTGSIFHGELMGHLLRCCS